MTTRRTFLLGALGAVATGACAGPMPDDATSTDAGQPSSASTSERELSVQARFVSSGPRDRADVALTFHTNGDLDLAQQLLDVTVERQVPITCFIVGNWLEANPAWATKLTAAGHELANHTFSHPTVSALDPDQLADEIRRCRDVLHRLAGTPGRYFRPSGTDDGTSMPPDWVLETSEAAGYATVVGFDVDPLDFRDPGSAAVVERTLDASSNGSIISLHFGHPGTIEALPAILDGLAADRLRPVTLSELLRGN